MYSALQETRDSSMASSGGGGGGKGKKVHDPVHDSTPAPAPSTFYRKTPVGNALMETLQTMVAEKLLKRAAVSRILESFDDSFPTIMKDADRLLSSDRKRKLPRATVALSGQLSNYNNLHEYWRIDLDDASVKIGPDARKMDHARLLLYTAPSVNKAKKQQ